MSQDPQQGQWGGGQGQGQGSYPPPVPVQAQAGFGQGPYGAPVGAGYVTPLGYAAAARGDLREIAIRQKVIMFCLLGYIGCVVAQFFVPRELIIVLGIVALAVVITASVFVFMLAIALYGTGTGVVMGILTLVPLVGLIILLVVNGKATQVLRAHGIGVGLMGASVIPGRNY